MEVKIPAKQALYLRNSLLKNNVEKIVPSPVNIGGGNDFLWLK